MKTTLFSYCCFVNRHFVPRQQVIHTFYDTYVTIVRIKKKLGHWPSEILHPSYSLFVVHLVRNRFRVITFIRRCKVTSWGYSWIWSKTDTHLTSTHLYHCPNWTSKSYLACRNLSIMFQASTVCGDESPGACFIRSCWRSPFVAESVVPLLYWDSLTSLVRAARSCFSTSESPCARLLEYPAQLYQ